MERVVYFLGAGFSAPLGLPVISNFLERARDLQHSGAPGASLLEEVFEDLDRLAKVKNTYASDQTNIEEILSILEMDGFIGKSDLRTKFGDFLRTVILHYTPQLTPVSGPLQENWYNWVFGQDRMARGYGYFVAAVQQLHLERRGEKIEVSRVVGQPRAYDIATTNYDCLPENAVEFLNATCLTKSPLAFRRRPSDEVTWPVLAKLHGSADGSELVPPTWNKSSNPSIAARWELAHEALARAQHIRFVGYSLPETDSYVRYLLKSAALKSKHLKTIDIVCRDPDGSVKQRYDEFIQFKGKTFRDVDVALLLSTLGEQAGGTTPPIVPAPMLENTWEWFIGRRG